VHYTLSPNQDGVLRGVLRVYDALGRQIEQMTVHAEGVVEFRNDLNPGIYFVQLESSGRRVMLKTVLVH